MWLKELSDRVGVSTDAPSTISKLNIPDIPKGAINPTTLGWF